MNYIATKRNTIYSHHHQLKCRNGRTVRNRHQNNKINIRGGMYQTRSLQPHMLPAFPLQCHSLSGHQCVRVLHSVDNLSNCVKVKLSVMGSDIELHNRNHHKKSNSL